MCESPPHRSTTGQGSHATSRMHLSQEHNSLPSVTAEAQWAPPAARQSATPHIGPLGMARAGAECGSLRMSDEAGARRQGERLRRSRAMAP